jgi:hypothetical protein
MSVHLLIGLFFVLVAVVFTHSRIPAYRSNRARRRGGIGTLLVAVIFGFSYAACGFPKSGPITIQADGQLISNLEITAPPGVAGINLNGHSYTSVDNVVIHHADKAGIAVHGGHDNLIQNAMIDGGAANSGDNIYCYNSPNLWVSNSRVTGGYRGVEANHCDGAVISGLEGTSSKASFPEDIVSFLSSANVSLQTFSNLNTPANQSKGDVVNAWQSKGVRISSGLIDGVYCPDCVAVQADEITAHKVVSDVDVVHAFNGFAAYGAGGNSILFSSVRVRDAICSSSLGVPSSGNIPFIGACTHDDPACTLGGQWIRLV